MANFFVCENGPMGGISIVFLADTLADANRWMAEEGKGRDLYLYHQISAA